MSTTWLDHLTSIAHAWALEPTGIDPWGIGHGSAEFVNQFEKSRGWRFLHELFHVAGGVATIPVDAELYTPFKCSKAATSGDYTEMYLAQNSADCYVAGAVAICRFPCLSWCLGWYSAANRAMG